MSNVGRTASKNWLSLVLIFLFTFSVSLVGARFVRSILVGNSIAETQNDIAEEENSSTATEQSKLTTIKLQSIIDSWISELDYKAGLVIYDLDRDEVSASHNPDDIFSTSELNQLILAYDGYRRLDKGLERADSNIGYELNYSDCLNLMVRSENQTCATSFLNDGYRSESSTAFLSELGMTQTSDFGGISTSSDLTRLLKHIWQHEDLSLSSWARLQDSMLEPTNNENESIDWRQGLPSGFSTARVYSKASGEIDESGNWTNYSDLAIVDFVKYDRHFAIVVLGEGRISTNDFSRLGTLIEGKVLEAEERQ